MMHPLRRHTDLPKPLPRLFWAIMGLLAYLLFLCLMLQIPQVAQHLTPR